MISGIVMMRQTRNTKLALLELYVAGLYRLQADC